ncbi:MAG: hypothetical protein ACT6RD_02565 [Brevundimonas sp.]|uniref:hypothetical protein n=1 Tax=Brevundimonas sp. TaxID=1871086 RepID=UPI004034D1B1
MKLALVLSALAVLGSASVARAWVQTPTEIGSGQTVEARMAATGRTEADCFRFKSPRGAIHDVVVRSTAFDVRASVDSSCSGAVQNLDNAGGRDERFVGSSLFSWDRFIRVDGGGAGGAYSVSLKVYPVDPSVYAPPPVPSAMAGWSADRIWTSLDARLGQTADFSLLSAEESLWFRYHMGLSSAQRAAGMTRWVDANVHWPRQAAQRASAPQTPAPAPAPSVAAAVAPPASVTPPAPRRLGRCVSSGVCYYAVVAHFNDEYDPYQPSYDGTRLSWGIQVSDTAGSRFTEPFTICGIQVYAQANQAERIRGYMKPTSESYARRFSLSPHDGGFPICAWSPPRYTGPNR